VDVSKADAVSGVEGRIKRRRKKRNGERVGGEVRKRGNTYLLCYPLFFILILIIYILLLSPAVELHIFSHGDEVSCETIEEVRREKRREETNRRRKETDRELGRKEGREEKIDSNVRQHEVVQDSIAFSPFSFSLLFSSLLDDSRHIASIWSWYRMSDTV
jgi:hypothetical protein